MEIDIIGLISACSYALDCIEAELVNIKNKHGKRVAYISVRMGQYFDLPEDALQDLAICALLHDNALTQYISEELQEHSAADLTADLVANTTNLHCIYGEQNLAKIPFKTDVTNAILYHHEHADGTGPFHKKWDEVPLSARIIHLADVVDIIGHSGAFETQRWDVVKQYLIRHTDKLFDAASVDAFSIYFQKTNLQLSGMTPLKRSSGRSFQGKNRPLTGKPAKILPTFLRRSSTINLLLQADTPSVLQRKPPHLQRTPATIPHRSRKCIWPAHFMISAKWQSTMIFWKNRIS